MCGLIYNSLKMESENILSVIEYKKGSDVSYYLKYRDIQIGRCVCVLKSKSEIFIKYITIYKDFRGCDMSSIFYRMMENKFINNEIMKVSLMAEEIVTKHKKLESLYESWGFVKTSERYTYNCNTLVRHIHMYKMFYIYSKL